CVSGISCHLDPSDTLGVNSGRDLLSILKSKISHFDRNDILVKAFVRRNTAAVPLFEREGNPLYLSKEGDDGKEKGNDGPKLL
ncbi:MAG: hypothetical protein MUO52_10830, partial [Desulfobacterales bacterium]|nr:hypothetical protein [Desulfobacterales bacterium]